MPAQQQIVTPHMAMLSFGRVSKRQPATGGLLAVRIGPNRSVLRRLAYVQTDFPGP
jgi:hypothetical protein